MLFKRDSHKTTIDYKETYIIIDSKHLWLLIKYQKIGERKIRVSNFSLNSR